MIDYVYKDTFITLYPKEKCIEIAENYHPYTDIFIKMANELPDKYYDRHICCNSYPSHKEMSDHPDGAMLMKEDMNNVSYWIPYVFIAKIEQI